MTLRERLTEATGKPHLSYSSIKYALGDMRLWEMYMKGQLKKESDALVFGTLYDMLLFERDKAYDQYYVLNDDEIVAKIGGKYPRNTKKYKEWKAEAAEKNQGKTLVSSEDWKKANDMITRLADCGLIKKRLTGRYQVEFNEDVDGIPLKGFLDCLGDGYITDSKSSRSVDKFRYDVNSFCYDIQAYIYTKVFGIKDYYWVVQEKAYPYLPAVYKASEETLDSGKRKVARALNIIREHYQQDKPSSTFFIQGEI